MQIQSIEAIPVRIPLRPERRMISALGRHEVSQFVIVRLITDQGIVGVGEATVTPRWSGETVWGACAMIEHVLSPVVVGCDPQDVAMISERMEAVTVYNWFARAAIDMACWDVVGRSQNRPVYELLGGAVRPLTIRNRFSLGAYEPDVAAHRAENLVHAGFTTIKVKVGTDPEQDVRRVHAVRKAIGHEVDLTIDANGGWNYDQALWCLQRMQDCRIMLVEQPLPRGNYSELRKLRETLGIRILADESCFDLVEARELIHQNCCDAITLYPGKQGGLLKARQIAELAERHQIPCTIGSNLEWDVGAAAMLHFVVSTANVQIETIPGDCLGPSYHEFSIARNPLRIEGPMTTLQELPGLGIDVDWDLVDRYRMDL